MSKRDNSREEDSENTATKKSLAGAGGEAADPPSQPSSPTSPTSVATKSSVKASLLSAKAPPSNDTSTNLESGQHTSSRLTVPLLVFLLR